MSLSTSRFGPTKCATANKLAVYIKCFVVLAPTHFKAVYIVLPDITHIRVLKKQTKSIPFNSVSFIYVVLAFVYIIILVLSHERLHVWYIIAA